MSLPQNSISRPRFLCNCEPAVLYVRMLSGTVLARQTFASRRFLVRAVAAKLSALIAGVGAPCVEGLRFFPSFRENASRLFCAPLYRTRPIVSMEHSYICRWHHVFRRLEQDGYRCICNSISQRLQIVSFQDAPFLLKILSVNLETMVSFLWDLQVHF